MSGAFKAIINGTTVYSSDTRIQLYNGTSIASGTLKIAHSADGSKSFSYSCEAGVYTYAVSVKASGTGTLTTIPRASSVSAKAANMGSSSAITITRASSAFTHTLTYSFGSASGTIATKTSSTSVSWSVPLSLANQIPKAVSGTCTITCTTYNGSTKIGSKTCTVTLSVPSSVKPTLTSITAERVDGTVPSSWGIYVQNKSKVKLTINGAAGAYGSTISSYSITGGGFTSTSSSYTTGLLTTSGSITFTAKVTDSRGRVSDEKTVSISVVAYSPPSFSSCHSQRANSSGDAVDDGTYILATAVYSFSSCSSKNSVTRETYYKKSSESSWTNANKSFDSNSEFTYGGEISTESSYDIKYVLTDAFTSVSILDTVSTAAVLMDFKAGGKGIAIGKVSETDNLLDVAFGLLARNGITSNGVAIERDDKKDVYFTSQRTDTGTKVGFGVGSGGKNHGVWSYVIGKWMIHSDGTDVFVNGKKFVNRPVKYASGSVTVNSAATYAICDVTLPAASKYLLVGHVHSSVSGSTILRSECYVKSGSVTRIYDAYGRGTISSGGGTNCWAYVETTASAAATVGLRCYGYLTSSHTETGYLVAIPLFENGFM